MKKKTDSQTSREFYHRNYDQLSSFISYYYQIDIILELVQERLLEVGVGNKTVSVYLRNNGVDVTTCDYNKNLEPDYIADIRKLPFENDSFDVVMACEVLEHLPWCDLSTSLAELQRVTSKYVVVSLPVISAYLELVCKFPLINNIFKCPFFDIFLTVPLAVFRKCSVHHHWEIGLRGFPIRKIRKAFRQYFSIIKEVRPVLNPRHRFFVLEKTH